MKKSLLLAVLVCLFASVDARHITGGEVIYDYLRPGSVAGSKVYRITLRLFRDENCLNCADLPASVTMGVFNNDNFQLVGGYKVVNLSSSAIVPTNTLPPCITNAPTLTYRVGYYPFEVELLSNTMGFSATFQTCCRIDNINNTGNSVGATYTCKIPAVTDKSPRFSLGISIVCYRKPFTLDFSATDPDPGDSLVYSMCDAYNGGNAVDASFATPAAPPYQSIAYTNGFSGGSPLGSQASINPQTGIISGVAPNAGKYVVSVCINTYRNGAYVSTHRKDFIVTVASCDFAGAELQPDYLSCDGFSFDFQNLNNSPLNQSYYWDFNDPGSGANNISNLPNPSHTFSDTGVYNVKVVVNRGNPCSDSTIAVVRVYPGFFPDFDDNTPICKGNPVQFNDQTTANYGTVNSWFWDFGNLASISDTSNIQNPAYTYQNTGTYSVGLIVGSDKGCRDTLYKDIRIVDKPTITLSSDTLICKTDTLQIFANPGVPGTVSWSPAYNIDNTSSSTPFISPDVTTTYLVTYTDLNNCSAQDSVRINVLDSVEVDAGNDTTICLTDPVTLNAISNALYFQWTPSATLNDGSIQNPIALPTATTTTYTVKASISGNCFGTDQITVSTIPYPVANASNDTTICLGGSAILSASGGSSFTWSPSNFLNFNNIANPVSIPTISIRYVVSVRDNLGCPKPGYDTVLVNVINVVANAGPRDTMVVLGQPLQLSATGGSSYLWTPSTWLSSNTISNPISTPQDSIQYIVSAYDGPGCSGKDTINVKVFYLEPGFQVPTAFSPNGDGLNDFFGPISSGLQQLDIFRIYNRWGQLIFQTSEIGKGWDGKLRGEWQPTGTYVWYAEGVTYNNNKVSKKGYVVLIRQ